MFFLCFSYLFSNDGASVTYLCNDSALISALCGQVILLPNG